MSTEKTKKNENIYKCEKCDFITSKKTDYNRHLLTAKHKFNILSTEINGSLRKNCKYNCITCDKTFKERSGLWRHNKICDHTICDHKLLSLQTDLSDEHKQNELIQYLMKENSEFKHLMIDQSKQMIELAKNTGHNSNNTTNSHNNNFNLNFFLNETCKNAMNIMDFVSELQVEIKDLEETGRLGFAEGISKIFINALKNMDVNDRPIHCSDFKRETLYIKDKEQWNKESEDKTILTNAIKHVAHKNITKISEWTKEYPEYNDSASKQNDKYLKIVCESMSGSTKEETNKNYNKIIKNILKETVIDK